MTTVQSLTEPLHAAMAAERDAAHDRLSQLQDMLQRLHEERGTMSERIAKLELLLEHPDVFAISREDSSFASPVVSIVMPTWNRGRVIGAAVRSVQAQRFADWELIVVDDGSADDTAAVMSTFAQDARIRCLRQEHAGQCKARNHGLAHARAPLIAYLDSDNVWYPGFLAAAVGAFAAKPETDCLYGAMVTDAHWDEHLLFRPFDRDQLLRRQLHRNQHLHAPPGTD